MNLLTKSTIGVGILGGLSGASYALYDALRTRSHSELLNDTLLGTKDKEDQEKWTARLASLDKAEENTLVNSLKKVKETSGVTWENLRDWCKDNVNNKNKGESDKEFKNIQNYCTFSIKEKLRNPIIDSSNGDAGAGVWAIGYTALRNIPEVDLVPKLKEALSKGEFQGSPIIKTWCTEAFEKPYKGEKEKEFKNASKVCVTRVS